MIHSVEHDASLARRRTSGCTGVRAAKFNRLLRGRRAGPVNLIVGLLIRVPGYWKEGRLSAGDYKLRVFIENGEIHIHATRAALRDLAETCVALSELTDEQARTGANHVHYTDYFGSSEDGSVPLLLCLEVDSDS